MKKKIYVKTLLVGVLALIVSIIILLILFVFENYAEKPDTLTIWKNIFLGVSCSVIASAIYSLIQRVYAISDENEYYEGHLKKLDRNLELMENNMSIHISDGVKSIHPKSHFDNEQRYWKDILKGASNRLDLTGHSISKWLRNEYKTDFLNKIENIVKSNAFVNIVLSSDEKQDVIKNSVREALKNPDYYTTLNKIERTIYEFKLLANRIDNPELLKHFSVYITKPSQVTYLYIRTDTQCVFSPYTQNIDDRQHSFLLEFTPTNNQYVEELQDDFEDLISSLNPVNWVEI